MEISLKLIPRIIIFYKSCNDSYYIEIQMSKFAYL